ncbi:Asp-tRNA(Asn)/Glu-tRNA(Gln) amidotransferase subunit GatB [Oceanivirga salmonicida]|uniref:Asp-tRNA(Asn)/Glu-tRNA(Gln) amidotransferase subunit GatB n=1 Tax=Oceanivirga salmonicida TaxID=1769291 RepID=UPI0012E20E69|nr:Asp-tRNA(Asn)/Glu-tRNA(Gln) amidotransferase subunit GatB [Oceanivirga salmonicida]
MNYESVIGLEVHIQLKTKSKIWCSASANYDLEDPNTCITPTSIGEPGALPKLNDEVLNYAIKAALALGCEINKVSYFDRKNYFYPDSPKNYQITQFYKPYAQNGKLEVVTNSGKQFNVEIERIQIEEDTAKSIHTTNESLLNFNRASMPLLEIITRPVIQNSEQAYAYLNALKERIKYTKVSDVSMELGSLRCDANVSVRKKGETKLGTRTETKNLNSFKAVVKAIEYEINRQIEVLEQGGRIVQETRLWDEENGVTRVMRSKEDAMDYRYFPDPDLPAVIITDERLEKMKESMPEFADEKLIRFINEYNIPELEAKSLVSELELSNYFEKVVNLTNNPRLACNWILTEVLRVLKEKNENIDDFNISADRLAKLIMLIENNTISSKIAKEVFSIMLTNADNPEKIVKDNNLVQVTDTGFIEELVKKVLSENPEAVLDLKNGRDRAMKHLMGQAMKLSKGKANPKLVTDLINKEIQK